MKYEYKIVEKPDTGQLEIEVTKLVNNGWKLVGGVAIRDSRLYQALVKKDQYTT